MTTCKFQICDGSGYVMAPDGDGANMHLEWCGCQPQHYRVIHESMGLSFEEIAEREEELVKEQLTKVLRPYLQGLADAAADALVRGSQPTLDTWPGAVL